jgi:acetylornithine deacetylase/succinyl-diaminopimelate desuccinylase-like protein
MFNEARLWSSLMEMAQTGATEKGGACRLAVSDVDRQACDLLVRWCREAGCNVVGAVQDRARGARRGDRCNTAGRVA